MTIKMECILLNMMVLDVNLNNYLSELKKLVNKLNIDGNKKEKILQIKYDRLYLGYWKKKGRDYEYIQVKGYEDKKHITIKTLKTEAFKDALKLIYIYNGLMYLKKAYCFFDKANKI